MGASVRSIGFSRLIAVCLILLAASVLALALPAVAHATETYYVSIVGSDSVGTGQPINPFATVQRAVNVAGAAHGGVVSVGVGTFSGDVTMTAQDAGVSLQGAGAPLTILQGDGHNSVIIADHVGAGVTISGFTITGGNSTGAGPGGGVRCLDSSPTIAVNNITGNSAGVGNGGGIYCSNASPVITGNTITVNTAGSGGGIYSSAATPTIAGNTVTGNSVNDGMGGDGGGICCSNSAPIITVNTVFRNTARGHGGGIACNSLSPTITGNIISGNTGGGAGGGIYAFGSQPTITGNTITGNGTRGGGGGIYIANAVSLSITNDVIAGNSVGGVGGGIYIDSSSPTITNETITGNYAPTGGGGGIFRHTGTGTPIITNCIIRGNADDVLYNCSATYSDLSVAGGGTGDISADPGFVAPYAGDYHLSADSQCLDVATSTVAPSTDKDGVARPWGAGCDMGAYEYYVAMFHTTTSMSGPASAKVNKTLTLSGVVSPTANSPYTPPGTVTISKTHKVGKVWKSAGSAKVGIVGGKYSYSFKPTAKGSWHFVASYSGGVLGPTTYLPSASGVKSVTVK